MAAIHSMIDEWTPAKAKDHRTWRAKMYKPEPRQEPAPAIVPDEPKVDADDHTEYHGNQARLDDLQTAMLRLRSEIAIEKQKLCPEIGFKQISVDYIIATVAKFYGCTARDIKCARRTWDIVRPRQVAMYLSRDLTLRSLPDIGRRMGDRDHTTILHGANKIAAGMKTDQWLCCEVALLEMILTGQLSLEEASA